MHVTTSVNSHMRTVTVDLPGADRGLGVWRSVALELTWCSFGMDAWDHKGGSRAEAGLSLNVSVAYRVLDCQHVTTTL